jgi:hypothetical protein
VRKKFHVVETFVEASAQKRYCPSGSSMQENKFIEVKKSKSTIYDFTPKWKT